MHWIKNLEGIEYFTSLNKESIVGCKILNYDSSFQYSSRRKFPYFKYLLPYGLKFKWFGIVNKYNYCNISENAIHQVDCISGSFMIFPKSLFDEILDIYNTLPLPIGSR